MEGNQWYQLTPDETAELHRSDASKGLEDAEAQRRLAENGPNELEEKASISLLALFLNQFKDFMVLVLMAATLISGLLGEYLDAVTIIAIILLNGVMGFIQEFRAERSLRSLKELSAPTAKVMRAGKPISVPASQLVAGDVVLIESGDRVPADVRWLETNSLYVEESALTGESVPVAKRTDAIADDELPLGDQRNLGFMGTMVTRGTGRGMVVRTGMATEMGKIADLIQNAEEQQTPLQHRLEQLGKILIYIALALTVVVVLAGIMHGQPPYMMFLAGVSLAVAAIPEGLPAIVTVALAIGVQRMIKRRAIVRKLPSVETLGCASVICSDKTGTLTQNKMTVTHVWSDGRLLEVSGEGYVPDGSIVEKGRPVDVQRDSPLRRLLQIAALCNNASLRPVGAEESRKEAKAAGKKAGKLTADEPAGGDWVLDGDPTEGALLALAAKGGLSKPSLAEAYKRLAEIPFESERKRMTVVVEHQGSRMAMTKGAPDVLLDLCSYILWNGQVTPLTPTIRSKVLAANEGMARSALRVIGMAYREMKPSERADGDDELERVERGLVFAGLAGMIDPPRREVRDAIAKCRRASIRTVMITGDHQTTAEAIARQLGMLQADGLVMTGRELEGMTDEELDARSEQVSVYARVSPEHKLRIVKSLQRRGHIVAMTGDGVNDAPAIKAADIGIAMGKSGTDVSREASSLVLSDDNFATIVFAIEEGRGIYENIRKFIRYLLASNVGEIMTMLLAMMAGMPMPLVPIQILWVNLVTDGLPAMALGVDQAEKDLMQQKPRPSKENMFARRLGWKIISRGLLIGLCTLGAFWVILRQNPGDAQQLVYAQTVAFATLVMAQLIHVFDCRSSRSIFHRNPLQNKLLVLAVLSSLALMLGVMYWEPMQPIFKTVPLGVADWLLVLVAAGIPTFFMGFGSLLSSRKPKRRKPAAYGGGYSQRVKPVSR